MLVADQALIMVRNRGSVESFLYLCVVIERGGQSLADFESGKRKVRATQGAIVSN